MITKLAQFTDIQAALVVGGLSLQAQATVLRTNPEIVVATPVSGRVVGRCWVTAAALHTLPPAAAFICATGAVLCCAVLCCAVLCCSVRAGTHGEEYCTCIICQLLPCLHLAGLPVHTKHHTQQPTAFARAAPAGISAPPLTPGGGACPAGATRMQPGIFWLPWPSDARRLVLPENITHRTHTPCACFTI
jgi:hypothetical protein